MKKGIIVLLIAVLVSGFAFADFSGSAGVRFDADLDGETFATTNPSSSSLDFKFTFHSEEIKLDSSEDEIHVEVAASAKFILGKYKGGANGVQVVADNLADKGIGAVVSLDTAKIVGKNWFVDITGPQSAYDYAKAPVLQTNDKTNSDDFGNDYYTDDNKQASSYKVAYASADGVTVGFNGFTVSGGFDYDKDYGLLACATVETPEFAFNDDAIKVQAAAEYSRLKLTLKDLLLTFAFNSFGASAKTTVAIQDITVGAAVDMGIENIGAEVGQVTDKETEFNIDARVDFKYSFIDASIYTYAGKAGLDFGTDTAVLGLFYDAYQDFYLEAKAAFDLNAFELPLKVTVSAKNLTNADSILYEKAGIEPKIAVDFAKDAIKAGASFDINTRTKGWNALAYGTYAFEKFTAGAAVKVSGAEELTNVKFGCFAETDKLVKGATFGLSYGLDSDNTYKKGGADSVSNGKFSADYKLENAGKILAFCKIAF